MDHTQVHIHRRIAGNVGEAIKVYLSVHSDMLIQARAHLNVSLKASCIENT